jgi:uncharacterized protein YicC (UPF0701 family)
MSNIPPDSTLIGEDNAIPTLAKIEALRAKEETAYTKLHASLQTQIDSATVEITQLEARLAIATGKSKAQIKSRLEGLQAKRDAAYEKLHASLQAQIDSIMSELKTLESKPETGTGDSKAQLAARLEALKARRDATQQYRQTEST